MSNATVKLLNEQFVPLACTVGYGKVLAASGKEVAPAFNSHLLPQRPDDENNPLAPERLRAVLAEFKMLPAADRKPKISQLPDLWNKVGVPGPPEGVLILREFVRRLDGDGKGSLSPVAEAEHDFLWMTKEEWTSLVPKKPSVGKTYPVPSFLVTRIGKHHADAQEASLHLRLQTEPTPTLTMTVESVSADEVRLRLQGSFQVVVTGEDSADEKALATVDYRAHGCLRYDVRKKAFTRFDIAVLGKVTPGKLEPSLRTPMVGLFFELSPGDSPFERLPPGRCGFAGLEEGGYWK